MNIRAVAVQILNFYHHQYYNYENRIATTADDLQLPDKDRDFLYILVKGVILYREYLDFVIEIASNRPINKLEKTVLNLLRIGVFQYLVLETPSHAFTYETVNAARELEKSRATGLINAVLRHLPSQPEILEKISSLPQNKALAIQTSHPEWLIKRWTRFYGYENARKIAEFNNNYQTIFFRHNPIKTPWDDLAEILKNQGFCITLAENEPIVYFLTDKPGDLIRSKAFQDGLMSVQDISQSFAVRLLTPQPDETIIDACAAPGGKTGMIAQIAGPHAKISAFDLSDAKLDLLKNEVFRLGIDFVNYGVADARTDKFPMVEKILLDVPCTGTGVIARRADLRWNRKPADLQKLIKHQRDILTNMAGYIKPGGVLVYSTCSIEPEENWGNIDWFLENNPGFKIENADEIVDKKWCDNQGAVQILPHIHKETGGFAVRLRKQ